MIDTTWMSDVLDIYANMVYDGLHLSKDQKEQIKEFRITWYGMENREMVSLCDELLNS